MIIGVVLSKINGWRLSCPTVSTHQGRYSVSGSDEPPPPEGPASRVDTSGRRRPVLYRHSSAAL
jgi:hypothetical protein